MNPDTVFVFDAIVKSIILMVWVAFGLHILYGLMWILLWIRYHPKLGLCDWLEKKNWLQ